MTQARVTRLVGLALIGVMVLFSIKTARAATNRPVRVGSVNFPSSDARAITHWYTYAFVANGTDGLQIINISVPSAPVVVGSLALPGPATSIDVIPGGQYLFIAGGPNMLVVDVYDKTAPKVVYQYPAETTRAVRIVNSKVYVLLTTTTPAFSGLHELDITKPWQPTFLTSYASTATDFDTYLPFDYSYLFDASTGNVDIVDTGAATPVRLGLYQPGASYSGASSFDLAFPYVYLGTSGGLQIIDINTIHAPSIAATYVTPPGSVPTAVHARTNAYVTRGKSSTYQIDAYVGESSGQLDMLNVQYTSTNLSKATTEFIEQPTTLGVPASIAYDDAKHYLYILNKNQGLEIVDVNTVGQPVITSIAEKGGKYLTESGITIQPFGKGYTRTLTGRKIDFGSVRGVRYIFVPSEKYSRGDIAMYDGRGGLIARYKPFEKFSANGMILSSSYTDAMKFASIAVTEKTPSKHARVYEILPAALTSRGLLKIGSTAGTTAAQFLETSSGFFKLYSMVDRKHDSLISWSFNVTKNTFIKNTKFDQDTLKIVGNTIVDRATWCTAHASQCRPKISNVKLTFEPVGDGKINLKVDWDVDQKTNGTVRWGPTTTYQYTTGSISGLSSKHHRVILSNMFIKSKINHFSIRSCVKGVEASVGCSATGDRTFTFHTLWP